MAKAKTVLATGAFDLLHPGHLWFIQQSKKSGGPGAKLVIVVARDRTIQARKGRKPIIPEQQRLQIVAALKPVSKAILGREEVDFLGILEQVRPDIVCFGRDQTDIKKTVQEIIKEEKLPVRVVQIPHYGLRGLDSSTALKRRVLKNQPSYH